MSKLPAAILNIEWNGASLIVGGLGWSLAVTSPWRVVAEERMLLGSDDATHELVVELLQDKMVIGCETQGRHAPLDLALMLEGGKVLEVFSVAYLEPWTLSLSGSGVYVASPSE
ncbi:hypothetical protein QFW77_05735 [Luteimonas sp. RD2P54]|uniref:Uncharacterized protein n=1 Tax=Luteimonas endophytica TaxID=3042023 RepID=A0ABT6J6N0_9GAMM|nr:hypothetical protein [Luteimonas endophytica]MDH5822491.1 hypothetical protein [Luteimonas endophytica]